MPFGFRFEWKGHLGVGGKKIDSLVKGYHELIQAEMLNIELNDDKNVLSVVKFKRNHFKMTSIDSWWLQF